ncbi:CAP domain-containing protein [Hyphomicrobium methylovorum]|uniref:CAP domain-containing protein n=1 Tax=Hyphomicrobium methylovorum TaxID=84 RepID=UPI0015E66428|nr:CAP domain-containing protein [Hyphomicrobium methylovorum]MBA2126487.1 CAP domain-containing protein [Hyphomicrobium methylovorum]
MYRVALAGLVTALAGCSLGSSSISSGFAESETTTASLSSPGFGSTASAKSVGLGGEPSRPRTTKVAALDKAPNGSFERAEPGTLSDRDYSRTALNAEMARDVINAYRKKNKLKPLRLNPELTEAAKAHSRDLAKWDRISHYGSDGSNPWDRVKRAGYNARLTAENVGTGQVNFNEVMRGWEESPGHNKNLLTPDAVHMGIALVQDPKTEFKSFWTLVVGAPM